MFNLLSYDKKIQKVLQDIKQERKNKKKMQKELSLKIRIAELEKRLTEVELFVMEAKEAMCQMDDDDSYDDKEDNSEESPKKIKKKDNRIFTNKYEK